METDGKAKWLFAVTVTPRKALSKKLFQIYHAGRKARQRQAVSPPLHRFSLQPDKAAFTHYEACYST